MSKPENKWNPPGWPWELELITLTFFLIALLLPYFHQEGLGQLAGQTANNGINVGKDALSTQFDFLLSLGIAGIYIFHLAFASFEVSRITVSPMHLLSPCIFAVIAYYRVDAIPKLQDTALSGIDGSTGQAVFVLISVALITVVLARFRTYRYLLNFDDTTWDITAKAVYDRTYFQLLMHLRPLLYAPRRYRACNEGIIIEGWFYAMPIGFNVFQSVSKLSGIGIMNTGNYFAASARELVRIELLDSIRATYISPENRDEFVMYCAQHVVRKKASHKHSPTRHGTRRASDTHAASSSRHTTSGNHTASGGTPP